VVNQNISRLGRQECNRSGEGHKPRGRFALPYLDVPMHDSLGVAIFQGLEELIHVVADVIVSAESLEILE
jgi:hypothetical protein